MKINQIINRFLAVMSFFMLLLTGCENRLEVDTPSEQYGISLSVDQMFQEKAYIRVRHDGGNETFWFYCLTEDLDSDAAKLIEEELSESLDFYGEILGNVGVNKNITFEDLRAKTNYRVLAATITPEGKICSNIADLTFCTLRDPDVFYLNENWDISYTQRAVSENNPDIETEIFTTTASDSLTYYPFVMLKSDFEGTYGSNIRKCFESYVDFRNSENIRWSRAIMVADSTLAQDRLRSNRYIAFMMGIDSEGGLTGYYAMKDVDIKQETPCEAYASWLGEWTVSGTAWDNSPKSYDIEIKADENNLYYKMYGWEGDIEGGYYDNVPQNFPITLYFEKSTGYVYVVSGYMGEPLEDTLFYLYGNADINDSITPINIENLKVARFSYVNGKPHLSPEKYGVYDAGGNYLSGEYMSFSYCYTLRGYEYVGFAPFTADSKVPNLNGITIEKK